MKKNIIIILSLLSLMACDNSLEINAPYKEIPVVYGLIDKNDTVQYIRIEKVFQNSIETKASAAAKISDSLYLKNLSVKLIVNKDTINCVRTNEFPKNAGFFANDVNYIYKSSYYVMPSAGTVNLLIIDTVTGNVFTSHCTLIGDQTIDQRNITISDNVNNNFRFIYTINYSAHIIDAAVRLKYLEASVNSPTVFTQKQYDYYIQSGTETSALQPLVSESIRIYSKSILDDWRSFFATQPTNVIRKYMGVEFVTWGAGPEFLDIQEMNKPNFSFVQKRTDYSNITNGLGIFSARTNNVESRISVDAAGIDIINTLPLFQK